MTQSLKLRFKPLFEQVIHSQLSEKKEVAVLCSGGVDSLTCVFALLNLGYTPIIYSFHLDSIISEDFQVAKKVANQFNLKFKEIIVPTNKIKQDFLTLINKYKCNKKTQVECTFPWLYIFPKITEKDVISGVCADGHYGLSKKAMIHYRYPKQKFDYFREDYFSNENPAGIRQMEFLAKEYDLNLISPYVHKSIYKYFLNFDWDDINKPYQKALIINNYLNYFKITGRRPHKNLQLNAGIPMFFKGLLLDPKINFKNRKRVMDLIRDYVKLRDENNELQKINDE